MRANDIQPQYGNLWRKSKYYKAFEDTPQPLNCCDVSLFVYRMMAFVSETLRRLVEDFEEKSAMLVRALDSRLPFERELSVSGQRSAVVKSLIQQELFADGSHWLSRNQLCDLLGVGRRGGEKPDRRSGGVRADDA